VGDAPKRDTPALSLRIAKRLQKKRYSAWPKISSKNGMPVFSGANLIGGLVFGSVGFVAFIYGKRMNVWKPMFIGLALMVYPYFVANDIALFVIGAVGTAALFLFRE
jgi:hypothetical protein